MILSHEHAGFGDGFLCLLPPHTCMTADSTGDGEKSFREKVNEELDERQQIDDDSDKSFGERVNDIQEIRNDGEQSESGSQVSRGSVLSSDADGTGTSAVIVIGRVLVMIALLLVGLYLVGSAVGFW